MYFCSHRLVQASSKPVFVTFAAYIRKRLVTTGLPRRPISFNSLPLRCLLRVLIAYNIAPTCQFHWMAKPTEKNLSATSLRTPKLDKRRPLF